MASYLDYLNGNGGNGGKGNNTTMFILVCICCMCISFSVAAFLIYKYSGTSEESFAPHNEQRHWS